MTQALCVEFESTSELSSCARALQQSERAFVDWFRTAGDSSLPYIHVLDPENPTEPVRVAALVDDEREGGTFPSSGGGVLATTPRLSDVDGYCPIFLPARTALTYFIGKPSTSPKFVAFVVGSALDAAVVDLVPGAFVVGCSTPHGLAALLDINTSPVGDTILGTTPHIVVRVVDSDEENRVGRIEQARLVVDVLLAEAHAPVFAPFVSTAGAGSIAALRDLYDVVSHVIVPRALEADRDNLIPIAEFVGPGPFASA